MNQKLGFIKTTGERQPLSKFVAPKNFRVEVKEGLFCLTPSKMCWWNNKYKIKFITHQ